VKIKLKDVLRIFQQTLITYVDNPCHPPTHYKNLS